MKNKLKVINVFISTCIIFLLGCTSSLIKTTNIIDEPNPTNTIKENVVIYVAHQDDDVFIYSKIIDHLKSKDNVYVVYTCLSYQKGEEYKKTRKKEAISALGSINIPVSNIIFLGYPDMNSHKHLNNLINKTDSLFKKIKPNVIYTSAYEGGNIDHDVANFVVSYLKYEMKYSYIAFEFPEYSGYKTILTFKLRSFPEVPKTYIKKLQESTYEEIEDYWDFYESQKFPFGLYMSLTSGKNRTFGYEYYRILPKYDYLQKPPTKEIVYENYLATTFDEFKEEVTKIISIRNLHKKWLRRKL